MQSVVIRIGRNLTRAASTIAVSSGRPACIIRWRVKSSRMIPFFTISPTSRIKPMNDETFSGVPVISNKVIAPTNDSGAASKTTSGSTNDWNCNTITPTTLATASASTSSRPRNASCWLAYCPPSSIRIPEGGFFFARTAFTSFMTEPRDRPLTSEVIAIICC